MNDFDQLAAGDSGRVDCWRAGGNAARDSPCYARSCSFDGLDSLSAWNEWTGSFLRYVSDRGR